MLHFSRVVVNRNFTTKRFQEYCKATKYYRSNGDPQSLSSQSSLDELRKRKPLLDCRQMPEHPSDGHGRT